MCRSANADCTACGLGLVTCPSSSVPPVCPPICEPDVSTLLVEQRTVARTPVAVGRLALTGALASLAVVAVGLRIWDLGNVPGLNGDEAWAGVQIERMLHGEAARWTTPTGNPLNPFFFGPQLALHALCPPSVTLLRIVPLVSGLAALLLNFVLCYRAFDRKTAAVSTLILALMPLNIAYSRFAWDTCQSLPATLLVLYLPLISLRRRGTSATITAGTMLALAAAIVIHPTNVFALLLPLTFVAYARRQQLLHVLRATSIPARPWVFAALAAIVAGATFTIWNAIPHLAARLHGTGELGAFAHNYLRFFSGSGIYEYISGAGLAAPGAESFAWISTICDLAFAGATLAALVGAYRRMTAERILPAGDPDDDALVLGWFVMVLAFFIVAGPRAIAPHFERYGICLVAPGALVLARGLTWWIEQPGVAGRRATTALVLATAIWPTSFAGNYFACFRQTGGLSHATFRTAAVEPKLAALELVRAGRSAQGRVTAVCSSWWLYWPIAYLASDDLNLQVVTSEHCEPSLADENHEALALGAIARGAGRQTWFIEFAGSDGEARVRQAIRDRALNVNRHVICDSAGRELVSVIGPAENFSQNY
jgi:hypothetical protein